MSNLLTSGSGALPAPSPDDQKAVPPMAMPAPGPSDMQQHFTSAEDVAEEKFKKISEAASQLGALRRALDKLGALGDTVTTDDLVEAAGDLVANGIPAVQIAATLAEAPEQPAQLQAWVAEQSQKLEPAEAQVAEAKKAAGLALGSAAFKGILVHSAEDHFQKRALANAQFAGRAN